MLGLAIAYCSTHLIMSAPPFTSGHWEEIDLIKYLCMLNSSYNDKIIMNNSYGKQTFSELPGKTSEVTF